MASHGAHLARDNLFNLEGRLAQVTGAGSSIGLMAPQALVTNGAKVYITGRTREKLDRAVEQYHSTRRTRTLSRSPDLRRW